ncbi:hypothetical protein [Bdellovibrio sp. HCB-110]|uniref:hypothetical protein n=1 Tax=Bdellovibrio sp. HCB-110 TaxID=3391182 RepID=UPI0039B37A0C
MTIEKFLSFWDQHNTVIIESLIALVLILSLFLAYRSFFGKKSKEEASETGHGLDAAQLEKTLQKILDNQNQTAKPARGGGASEDLGMDVDLDEMERTSVASKTGAAVGAAEVAGESAAEVSQLRLTLNESHQKIETLQKQLKEALVAAEASAAAGGASAGAGGAEGGMSSQEKDELSGKVRDLEARLAEYEIISEDIADLSRYREENDQLKQQLEALKAGAGVVASAPTPPPQQAAPEPEPVPEPAPAPVEEPTPAAEPPAQESASADLIDDELMKEFAAAVEGQKALDKAAEKAGDGSETAKSENDESDKLMSEFENFVSKKS